MKQTLRKTGLQTVMLGTVLVVGGMLVIVQQATAAEDENIDSKRQSRILERYPDADLDGDGTLTREEAKKYFADRREQQKADRSKAGSPRNRGQRGFGGPGGPGGFGGPDGPPPGGARMGLGFGPPDPEKILKEYPEADIDGDGKLDRDEVHAHMQQQHSETIAKILADHPELDKDQDGKLSPEEMRAGRETIEPYMRAEAAKRILADHPEADKDGDGKLSESEMRTFMATQHKGMSVGGAQPGRLLNWILDNFDEVDADGNGQLSKEELTKLRDRFGKQDGQGFGRGEPGGPDERGFGRGPGGFGPGPQGFDDQDHRPRDRQGNRSGRGRR